MTTLRHLNFGPVPRIDSNITGAYVCDADYVGFTSRHLHQRVEEHKRSVIGNHVKDQHGKEPQGIAKKFKILIEEVSEQI